MKKSAILTAVLLGSMAFSAAAQSGRKAAALPKPTPAPAEDDPGDYSESKPNASRIYAPARTKDQKSKSESKPETKTETKNENSSDAAAIADDEVIKVDTDLVTIPVSVYERSGVYISGLRQSDFKIFENGKQQEIAYFGTTEQPFTVILLIDTSPSTSFKIEEIQDAAINFIQQLNPEDKVMVVEFDSSVHTLTDFTNDRQQIARAIRRADFGDGTSLYDAVEVALRKRLDKITGRKAIVLFTDGVDTTSRASFDGSLALAEEADAVVYSVYYNTFFDQRGIGRGGAMSTPPILGIPQPGVIGGGGAPSSADYVRGRTYLQALAEATGGQMFRAEATTGGLGAAFDGIVKELRSQYSIGYYPQEGGQTGERRQIKVRVDRPNVAVRARDSYVVGGK